MSSEAQIKTNMDRMYRWTRHVYDASRKYYLLGRDILIGEIKPAAGEHVCEIGCGTARNLIKMARRYPQSFFHGLDASEEMLKTARHAVRRQNLSNILSLKQGLGQSFDPAKLFDLQSPLDKIVLSYTLSIIPTWRETLDHAVKLLRSGGGEIHLVDFSGQEGLPAPFRTFLFWWLARFHVYHRPELLNYLRRLEVEKTGTLKIRRLYKGYAIYAVFKKA